MKMKQFNHPNVMNLIGVCLNAGPAPYIVMPFMANGSLLSYLREKRPNLILDETADEDSVSIILFCSIVSHTNLPIACQLLVLLLTTVKMSAKVSDFKRTFFFCRSLLPQCGHCLLLFIFAWVLFTWRVYFFGIVMS